MSGPGVSAPGSRTGKGEVLISEFMTTSQRRPLLQSASPAVSFNHDNHLDQVLDDELVDEFLREYEIQWEVQSLHWIRQDHVELYPEVLDLTVRTAYSWAGLRFRNHGFQFRVARYRRMLRDRQGSIWSAVKARWSRWMEARLLRLSIRRSRLQRRAGHRLVDRLARLTDAQGRLLPVPVVADELLNFTRSLAEVAVLMPFAAQTMKIDENFMHDVTWDVGRGDPRHDIVSGAMNLGVKYLTERLRYDVPDEATSPEKIILKNVERRMFSIGHR